MNPARPGLGHAFQVLIVTGFLFLSLLPDPPLPRALLVGLACGARPWSSSAYWSAAARNLT